MRRSFAVLAVAGVALAGGAVWAVSGTHAPAPASASASASDQPVYLDPSASVDARVADLMSRMTLLEKVGFHSDLESVHSLRTVGASGAPG